MATPRPDTDDVLITESNHHGAEERVAHSINAMVFATVFALFVIFVFQMAHPATDPKAAE